MRRPLPAWSQCRVLLDGELFLLNPTRADSFDSRYFGPLDASFVRGRALPLFTSSAS
jgi:type IV secretory pathway protease TraF